MQLFRRWGELTVWVRFSCSCVCPLLHCAHPILSGTSCSLSLLPLGEFILTAPCYWLCCVLCLQKLSHLLCLEKPCSFPLRPRSEASSLPLSPLICFLPGLLDLQKEALNHSNLCVPIIVFFFISLLEPWSHYTGEWHVKFLPATLVQGPYPCCSLNFQQSLLYLIRGGFKKMFAELKTVAKTASVLFFFKADINWNKTTILLGFKIM